MSIFKGSGVALCTPFTDEGINENTLRKLINFQLNNYSDALVILGTTGEPSTMTEDEKERVISVTVEMAKGKLPVIVGTGGNNTKKVIADSIRAEKMGADALLVVTPYYNKATPKGLYEHYKAVSDAIDIPIIVYNVPSRTGLNVSPETLARLATIKNIKGVKEASGNISQIAEVARLCPEIDLISGNDDQITPILALGGCGVISTIANLVPKEVHDLVMMFFNGDIKGSIAKQLELNPLTAAVFSEVNPIPAKTALRLMDYNMGNFRLPLCEMEEATTANLIKEMKKLGLIK